MSKKGPTPRNTSWKPFKYMRKCDPNRGLGGERLWENNRYVVIVAVLTDYEGAHWPGQTVVHLSIRRRDRAAGPFPWRDMHRIKCELVGSESEAVELFPAATRNLDGANQRHLFCTAPGLRFDWGFDAGRNVEDDETMQALLQSDYGKQFLRERGIEASTLMGRGQQAPFEDGKDYDIGHDGLIWAKLPEEVKV